MYPAALALRNATQTKQTRIEAWLWFNPNPVLHTQRVHRYMPMLMDADAIPKGSCFELSWSYGDQRQEHASYGMGAVARHTNDKNNLSWPRGDQHNGRHEKKTPLLLACACETRWLTSFLLNDGGGKLTPPVPAIASPIETPQEGLVDGAAARGCGRGH